MFVLLVLVKLLTIIFKPGADPGFPVRGRSENNGAERSEARKYLGYFV